MSKLSIIIPVFNEETFIVQVLKNIQAVRLDLHIEKLTSDHSSLSAFEKLTLQLQTLEKYLDLAVAHRQPSMIVIHGLGTGKLRDEVHEILRMRRDVKSFINRYHSAYGYGATEVFFQLRYSG